MDNYVTMMHRLSEKYANLMLQNFKYYLKIYGTDIIVRRSTNDEYREALGSAYVFDGTSMACPPEVYQKRIVINRSQLLDRFKTTVDDLTAYTIEDFYIIGDQIEFYNNDYKLQYKVNNVQLFDPYSKVKLFQITLSGFEEYKLSE